MKKESPSTGSRKRWLGTLILCLLAVAWGVIFIYIGRPILTFASHPDQFRAWIESAGIWGRLGYLGMVILQVLVAVIPGEPLEIVAGYAFGAVEGTLLCLLGTGIGSILVFFLVRRFGTRVAELFCSREKLQSLRFLHSSPKRRALLLLLLLIPGTPKDLLCCFAGLTDISWRSWLLIASVGRIPSVITSTIGGDALGVRNYTAAAIIFTVTLLISLIGLLFYRNFCKRQEHS